MLFSLPYSCKLSKCACGKGRVPDIIFSTVEPPPNIPITGHTRVNFITIKLRVAIQ